MASVLRMLVTSGGFSLEDAGNFKIKGEAYGNEEIRFHSLIELEDRRWDTFTR